MKDSRPAYVLPQDNILYLLGNLRGASDHIPDRRELLLDWEMHEETPSAAKGGGLIVHGAKAKKGKGGSFE